MRLLTLSKKETQDIFANRIYIFLVVIQVMIILGSFLLAIMGSVAADPHLINEWGGEQLLKVGVPTNFSGTLLEGELKKQNLSLVYYEDMNNAKKHLGSEVIAILDTHDDDVDINVDTSNVFYTVTLEKLREATKNYLLKKRLIDANIPIKESEAFENPINIRIISFNEYKYDPVAIESSYFVEIMYGFIVPFVLFLPFFLGSNIVTDSIVGEKERKTFEVLLMTPLSPTMIVIGKILPALIFSLIQSIAWIILLWALKVPLYNIPILVVLLLFVGLGFIGTGMLISTIVDSTKEANAAITLVLFFATFILYVPLFMDTPLLSSFLDSIPTLLLVKIATTQHLNPQVILEMIPSAISSLTLFGVSTILFRKGDVIRL